MYISIIFEMEVCLMSTIEVFKSELTHADAERALIFATNEGPIGAGYHVTELRLNNVKSIDCAGRQATWQDGTLQLLDGYGEAHMKVSKLGEIIKASVAAIPELESAPLHVEFAPGNEGLRLYNVNGFQRTEDALIVQLQEQQAACKPAQQAALRSQSVACC